MNRYAQGRSTAKAAVICSLLLLPYCSYGESNRTTPEDRKFETQTVWGLGFAPGVGGMGSDCTTTPISIWMVQRLRLPRYSQFGLEAGFVAPGGLSFSLLVDVARFGRFRIHLIDPGIVVNLTEPGTVQRVHRTFDLTLGAGVDIRLNRELALTANWRMFFPDPVGVISRYGDFARPVYAEAAKGGQLWIGLARVW